MKHLIPLLFIMIVAGCEDPHSDMGKQNKSGTYEASTFFPDGTSARPLPPGVIPREGDASQIGSGVVPLNTNIPFPVTAQVLAHGGQQFDIYCAVCHGRLANGNGMIAQRGFTHPPSFHMPRLKNLPDAHYYNVITRGYGAMFSYNDRIPPRERWEIVAYIRALQHASDGSNISDEDRTLLTIGGDPQFSKTGGKQ